MPDAAGQNCHPSEPLPLVLINGTADKIVPCAGGTTDAGFGVWGTDCTLAFFRSSMAVTEPPGVRRRRWQRRAAMRCRSWSTAEPDAPRPDRPPIHLSARPPHSGRPWAKRARL